MKRILSLLAVAVVSLTLAAEAQAQVGIVAGLTSSSTRMNTKEDVQAISLYHAGVTYKLNLGYGFSVQPSVLYQVKGAKLGELNSASDDDFKLKTGFVEVPVDLQWGPELLAFRPYLFVEPFVGYVVSSADKAGDADQADISSAKNKFEYGFGFGGGLEIATHIQLSVQYFNNMGPMFNRDAAAAQGSWAERFKNFKGIKFTVGILF